MDLSFKVSAEEIKKQVEGYYTLKFLQTARGILVSLIIFSLLITTLLGSWLMSLSLGTIMISLLIYSILGTFIYQGYKWAVIVFMIFWTLEKASQIIRGPLNGGSIVVIAFWWILYMQVAWEVYLVERARKKLSLNK